MINESKYIKTSTPSSVGEQFQNIKFSLLKGVSHKPSASAPSTPQIFHHRQKRQIKINKQPKYSKQLFKELSALNFMATNINLYSSKSHRQQVGEEEQYQNSKNILIDGLKNNLQIQNMKKKKPLTGKIKKYTPKSAFGISKLKNAKKMQVIVDQVNKKQEVFDNYFLRTYQYPFFSQPQNKEEKQKSLQKMVKSKKLKIKKEKEISDECTEIPLNLLKVLMDPPKSEQKISRKQRKTIKICKKLIDLETERIEQKNEMGSKYLKAKNILKNEELPSFRNIVSYM